MNPLEALMWRAEADPRMRSTMVALEMLDTTPDWDRFLEAHAWATRMVPRFRELVVEPALGIGAPCWAVDENFDLHFHVRRVRLPAPGSFAQLLAAVEQLAMAAFDKARSPWEAVLFEGLPEGKSAYALKMHHSATDGIGGIQLLTNIHSRTREPNPDKPQPAAPAAETFSSTDAFVGQLSRDVRTLPRSLMGGGGDLLRALRRPDRAAADALRFGSSLRRVLADPDTTGSPLLAGRSLSWRFLALEFPFRELRGATKTHGASINDGYLAALLAGFRMYHEELGQPIETMPLAIPISVRREGDSAGGNRFAGARLAGPVGIRDPEARMVAIGAMVRTARDEPAVDGVGLIAPALARLPAPLISQLVGGMTKANDLQASNVPGIREDVFLAGARIERLYPYAPLPGCAAMITMITHGETCCVGVNLDPAAITDS
ncbi:MAG: DUF1298 domain-containing protein [Thermoleophilaceae bacterium]|nr:DUF1298 domain-containing protein [Thermoleophilaceae bacterium]